jgi:hypothetical protein
MSHEPWAGLECPECGCRKVHVAGTGTEMHPRATHRDYLRGLLQTPPAPPTCHITFWSCENGHHWQTPTREQLEEIWKGDWSHVQLSKETAGG